MATTERSQDEFKVIGTRPTRPDDLDKVTGRAVYGADLTVPGTAYAECLRSPHAHAIIKRIDTSKAEALPGVLAVLTGADMPQVVSESIGQGEGAVDPKHVSDQVMAQRKAIFTGQPVAAVAALDRNTALEAAKLIKVDYELLKPVLSVDEAAAPGAPLVREDATGSDLGQPARHTNMALHLRLEQGDIAKGFGESTVVAERECELATVHQGYIEPHVCSVLWKANGRISVWTSTAGAFNQRSVLSAVLNVPESKITVTPLEVGGGFGGKGTAYLEPVAAVLSKKCGRPVKMVMDRKSVFDSTGPTPAGKVWVKLGVDDSGTIKAGEALIRFEAGAYPNPVILPLSVGHIFGSYRMENLRIDGYDYLVNKPKSTPYRAPGSPQIAFAMETVVDELCEQLRMDPLEFRLRNATQEGDRRPDGPQFTRFGNVEVQQAAKDSAHWNTPLEREGPNGRKRGRGVATTYMIGLGLRSSATISINADGAANLVLGSVDIGGGTRATMAMVAAEVLALPVEDVWPVQADTDSVGYNDGTFGSRTTVATGWAVYNAAHNVITEMKQRAARAWQIDPTDVEYVDGVFQAKSDPELRLPFKQMPSVFARTGGPVAMTGNVMVPDAGGRVATAIVDVEVDPETGKVDVLRATLAEDVGRAIHPAYVEGQIQGAVVQSIGYALHEEYYMSEAGVMENSGFLDYRMPTSLDVPMIEAIIVEVPNPSNPLGVRGAGEQCIVPPLPAIANAIYDAVGVRLNQAPMKPGRILQALRTKAGDP